MPGWSSAVIVVLAALVACDGDVPEAIPTPSELGAPSLPPGGVPDATSTYAIDAGAGASGERCRRLLRFGADGVVDAVSVCSARTAPDDAADPATWQRPIDVGGRASGEYVISDGVVVMRTVFWDPLAEIFEFDISRARACDDELRFVRTDGGRAEVSAQLVAGPPLPGDCEAAG